MMGKYKNFTPYKHVKTTTIYKLQVLKTGSLAIKPQRPVLTQNNIISCTQYLIINNIFMSAIEIFAVYVRM
jgi:hypothetical protein